MEQRRHRLCPVCGTVILGRIDKKFCSNECRVYFNNAKNRERHKLLGEDKCLGLIYSNAMTLYEQKSWFLLKIVLWISILFKILSTFEVRFFKYLFAHDKSYFITVFAIIHYTYFVR